MATGTIAPNPKFTGLDANGNPVAAGLLYTYTAGTSTPINTYTDVGLTVANANPIVLDSAGRATIFLTPGSSYKFNLQTSAGVTVWTQDNIAATPVSAASVDVVGTAGEAISAGNAVYLSDGSGSKVAGQWYKADAANGYSSTLGTVGMAPSAIASGTSGTIRLFGAVSGLSSLSVSAKYYIGTSGAITSTPATGGRFLGIADSATSLNLTPQPPVPQPWTVISTTSTGTQNDFAPGIIGNTIIRCNNATTLTLTGLAAGYDGQLVKFVSIGAGQVDFTPQSASSAAANRLINYATVGNTSLGAGVGTAEYEYDATTARWRLVAHEQGAWIAFTPVLGGSGGTSGQTYTTQSGAYMLRGRTLMVSGYVLLSAKGTITTSVQIQGFPYAAAATPAFTAATVGQMNTLATTWVSLNAYVVAGNSAMNIIGRTVASASVTALATADIGNTTDCMFAASYPVA